MGLWPLVILTVLGYGLSFAGFDDRGAASYHQSACAIFIIVGCIKGTPGPNQYGPDPLANIARKSAT